MIGFLFNKVRPLQVAFMSILLCYLIEILQLCHADWIESIRNYKLGGFLLGHEFLWSDLVSYTLGGISGYILESIYYNKNKTSVN